MDLLWSTLEKTRRYVFAINMATNIFAAHNAFGIDTGENIAIIVETGV